MIHVTRSLLVLALLGGAPPALAQHWVETNKIRHDVGGEFGAAVAIDGEVIVTGTRFSSAGSGSAQLFQPDPALPKAWSLTKSVFSSFGGVVIGGAVDVSGDTAVVSESSSALDRVLVFERDFGGPGAWGEAAQLTANPSGFFAFGSPASIDGDTIAVRAFGSFPATAYTILIYERDQGGPGQWGETARIEHPLGPGFAFGSALDLSGDRLVVGAPMDSQQAANAGAAYVFERNLGGASAWGERARLEATAPEASDQFGFSVSVSGDTVAVGVPGDNVDGGTGSVAVYRFQPASWFLEQNLVQPAGLGNWSFGYAVAVEGDRLVAGCNWTFPQPLGCALVFERDGPSSWDDGYPLLPCEGHPVDGFGTAVALSGDRVVVGAHLNNNSGSFLSGAVYVFEPSPLPPAVWESYCTSGKSALGCTPTLRVCGAPSATYPQGFSLSVERANPQAGGLFFFGTSGRQSVPWGNGTSFQCVTPPVKRGSLLNSGITSSCNGNFFQDVNALWCPTCPKPNHNPGSGAVVQAQLWYRDPNNTSNKTTALSNAVEFTVGP